MSSEPSRQESLGEQLGRRITAIAGRPLPDEIAAATASFILDSLGVTIAARRAPGIAELTAAMRALDPDGRTATLLPDGSSVSPATAALVNGAAAHALEFDDTHDHARIHALCAVLPAALAIAEGRGGVGGAAFVRAVAIGIEIFCRLGLSCPLFLDRGWHPTTAFGGIAAAATGAVLLSLDADRTSHAMAIAYAQMCGNTQSIADGSLTKRIGPGFAARNGVTAAYLARSGITGPRRFLDGGSGLFALYEGEDARADAIVGDLGEDWRLPGLSIKPFPCCRCSHSLIQLGIQLHGEGIGAEDIAGGKLFLGAVNHKVVNAPFDPKAAADPVVHAQFNACYAFARAILDGKVDLATFDRDTILDERSLLARRFDCEIASSIPATALAPAQVKLVLKDGSARTAATDTLSGSPEAPLTSAELRDKFAGVLAWGQAVPRRDADALADLIVGLADRSSTDALIAAVRDVVSGNRTSGARSSPVFLS